MWTNGKPIYIDGKQVAEVVQDRMYGFMIRNIRPNGTIGICHTTKEKAEVRQWLDEHLPGWTQ